MTPMVIIICLVLVLGAGVRSQTETPSSAPTCARPGQMDIVWVVDGSSSMDNAAEIIEDYTVAVPSQFDKTRDFVAGFTDLVSMSPTSVRQAVVLFAGEDWADTPEGLQYQFGQNIGPVLQLNDTEANSNAGFQSFLETNFSVMYGTTNTPYAIDYVRTQVLTTTNQRLGAFRIVILITDGYPTDTLGADNDTMAAETEVAVANLQAEDNALFVSIKVSPPAYPPSWFVTIADQIYEVDSWMDLQGLLDTFLCWDPTFKPTISPSTSTPSASPTTSTPTGAPTQCFPGNVTCCFTVETEFLQLFVNQVDTTANVSNPLMWSNSTAPKRVSFREPFDTAAIAFLIRENAEGITGGFAISCSCTRSGSPWNFVSDTLVGWRVVETTNGTIAGMPSWWYATTVQQNLTKDVTQNDVASFMLRTSEECPGPYDTTQKLKVGGFDQADYFAFRLTVAQPQPCGPDPNATMSPTRAPSSSPSSAPSSSPTMSKPSSAPSLAPSWTPSFSLPTYSPSAQPSRAPSTSIPTLSPSDAPSSSSPTLSPSSSPSRAPSSTPSSRPTTSHPSMNPSQAPSGSPSTSKPTSEPSMAPSVSPTSSKPSSSPSTNPSASPTFSRPSSAPSSTPTESPSVSQPTGAPSTAPTCHRPGQMDIVWVVDGSSSMDNAAEIIEDYTVAVPSQFDKTRDFVAGFTDLVSMSPTSVRQAVVLFAGEDWADTPDGLQYQFGQNIGPVLQLNDTDANSNAGFQSFLETNFSVMYGTTNTPYAIDYVRTQVLTTTNQRPGAFRIVILITDGYPTDILGADNDTMAAETEVAVANLQAEDNALFVSIKVSPPAYPPSWFVTIADQIYEVDSWMDLQALLDTFLCWDPTFKPTISPSTSTPSTSPTTSTPTGAPTQCLPGDVTCCFTVETEFLRVFVNEIDITANVSNPTTWSNSTAPKKLSFREPSNSAAIAFLIRENAEGITGGFAISCSSSRTGSPWTFVSDISTGWRVVETTNGTVAGMPSWWFANIIQQNLTKDVAQNDVASFMLRTSEECPGPYDTTEKLKVGGFNQADFFAFRLTVMQPDLCGTNSPTGQSQAPSTAPSASPSQAPSAVPSHAPSTSEPSAAPSAAPSHAPSTSEPSLAPSAVPSQVPTTSNPSSAPSAVPSHAPTTSEPSAAPSHAPSTSEPSVAPSSVPSLAPSTPEPSSAPSHVPSHAPTTSRPSSAPSAVPSQAPTTSKPSAAPSAAPSHAPSTSEPSVAPSAVPSQAPTTSKPSSAPSAVPSYAPSTSEPSAAPSGAPSQAPTGSRPTSSPSAAPSHAPTTSEPSAAPSAVPSHAPSTSEPSAAPSSAPSHAPSTSEPSAAPSSAPSQAPTSSGPTASPSAAPSHAPSTSEPSAAPSAVPSHAPSTSEPSAAPSSAPSQAPTGSRPTSSPSTAPSHAPSTSEPSAAPSAVPAYTPSTSEPSAAPSSVPSQTPTTSKPSSAPSAVPSHAPSTSEPSAAPSAVPSQGPITSKPSSAPSAVPSHAPSTSEPSAAPSSAPSHAPSTSEPSAAPSSAPSQAPTSSGPTASPSATPSHAPSTSKPSAAPSSVPSQAPTNSRPSAAPSSVPSQSPTDANPTASPSAMPSHAPSSAPSDSPSQAPTGSRPTMSPSTAPSSGPSAAPTCHRPAQMDIVWLVDASTSMDNAAEIVEDYNVIVPTQFDKTRDFVAGFTDLVSMSPTTVRQAVVLFAGEDWADTPDGLQYQFGQNIGPVLQLNDTEANSNAGFQSFLETNFSVMYGTTNTPYAIDYVRTQVLTTTNQRPGAFRIVILITDGYPTDILGADNDSMAAETEVAVANLQAEDNALFVSIKVSPPAYPPSWFVTIADQVYEVDSWMDLQELLDTFLCWDPTFKPTTSPSTSTPSTSPTTSTPTGAPTQCLPGDVTCCFTVETEFLKVFVNEIDITANVSNPTTWSNSTAPKKLSFREPSNSAAIAFLIRENAEGITGGFAISCSSSRTGSPWTFVSDTSIGWRVVETTNGTVAGMPSWWFANTIQQNLTKDVAQNDVASFMLRTSEECPGPYDTTKKLKVGGFNQADFFAFRLTVMQPDLCGTNSPTGQSQAPSTAPSASPSQAPSAVPSHAPTTSEPSAAPSAVPSHAPSTSEPSAAPSAVPSQAPTTSKPSSAPSSTPTHAPSTSEPSAAPSSVPSQAPTSSGPTSSPSAAPSHAPTTSEPSAAPSSVPSQAPTTSKPSSAPSAVPSHAPSTSEPSAAPSSAPSHAPSTSEPSAAPSSAPSQAPTSSGPTASPSAAPSHAPSTSEPSAAPSHAPSTSEPSAAPSAVPSHAPSTSEPSAAPSSVPSQAPTTSKPSSAPSAVPSHAPSTSEPSASPSGAPSQAPTSSGPTSSPSAAPSHAPLTSEPSAAPSAIPSHAPTTSEPSAAPSSVPSQAPTSSGPTSSPSAVPSHAPSTSEPSASPSAVPSQGPTTSKPTSAPSTVPSRSPTQSGPTPTPSSSPTASSPSVSPSFVPTTSTPTLSPSSSTPTQNPTNSPTLCQPGVVTCCFTMDNAFLELWINEVDVTSTVLPSTAAFNQPMVAKTVTFLEPSNTAVIGFKGTETNVVTHAGFAIKCNCTRPASPWNFVSVLSQGWYNVLATSSRLDQFPVGWYTNTYSGAKSSPTVSTGTAYFLNTTTCGSVNASQKLRAPTSNAFFTFAKNVTQTQPCGTLAPTGAFSPKPSHAPSKTPSRSPITDSPTKSPSMLPSFGPSAAPSKSPTVSAPTRAPTEESCVIGNVTCCLTMEGAMYAMYVNHVEVSGNLEPQTGVNRSDITKTITFSEPPEPAVIAFRGYSNNEFAHPSLSIKCVATRLASEWNFESTQNSGWFNIAPPNKTANVFPYNWFAMNYTGAVIPAEQCTYNPFGLAGTSCGAINVNAKIQSAALTYYFVFRKVVDQYCLSKSPTKMPTTHGPTGAPSFAPSQAPITSQPTGVPSSVPSQAPSLTPLNALDLTAFNDLSTELGREGGTWTDCNMTTDPCSVCSSNTDQHAVICEQTPITSGRRLDATMERRIVGLRFRNLNITGTISATTLGLFGAIRELNFSSDPTAANVNHLQLPPFTTCIDIARCNVIGVTCDFGPEVPLCNGVNTRSGPSQTETVSGVGPIIGIIVAGLFLIAIVVLLVIRRRSRSRNTMNASASMARQVSAGPTILDLSQQVQHGSRKSILSRKQSSAAPLASSWQEEFDVASGAKFWINRATGEFSWTNPEGAAHKFDPAVQEQAGPIFTGRNRFSSSFKRSTSHRSQSRAQGQWTEVSDDANGVHYWVNNATGEFSYTRPTAEEGQVVLEINTGEAAKPNEPLPIIAVASKRRTRSAASPTPLTSSELVTHFDIREELDRRTGEFAYINPLAGGNASTPAPSRPSLPSSAAETLHSTKSSPAMPREKFNRRTGEFAYENPLQAWDQPVTPPRTPEVSRLSAWTSSSPVKSPPVTPGGNQRSAKPSSSSSLATSLMMPQCDTEVGYKEDIVNRKTGEFAVAIHSSASSSSSPSSSLPSRRGSVKPKTDDTEFKRDTIWDNDDHLV